MKHLVSGTVVGSTQKLRTFAVYLFFSLAIVQPLCANAAGQESQNESGDILTQTFVGAYLNEDISISNAQDGAATRSTGKKLCLLLAQMNRLNSCCATVSQDIAQINNGINIIINDESVGNLIISDFNQTWTILNRMESEATACCLELNNKIDNLVTGSITVVANVDFNGTYTMLNAIQSDLDQCCFTLNSKVDVLQAGQIAGFAATNNLIVSDFNQTWTILNSMATSANACCVTLNNKIDALVGGSCDLSGTFTAIAAVQNTANTINNLIVSDFNQTWTILNGMTTNADACCVTLNSKIDSLRAFDTASFAGTFTAIAAVQNTVNTTNNLIVSDFNQTWTILNSMATSADACCATIQSDFQQTWTILNSINNAVSPLNNLITSDFNQTWTILNRMETEATACCLQLNNKIDNLVTGSVVITANVDFNGTYTMLNAIQSDLDQCCFTLNSKIDTLNNLVVSDFNQTWTILGAIQAGQAVSSVGTFTAIAAVSNLIASDFAATWTILNRMESEATTCCAIIQSDFQQTWTMIGASAGPSFSFGSVTTTTAIDNANLSLVQWAKTIVRILYGLA